MELKLLTENALFLSIFVVGVLQVSGVVLFRVGKSIRIVVLAGTSLALLVVAQISSHDIVLSTPFFDSITLLGT